ncbi:MAG: DNA/RNA non-specific endonuclease [Clostridia bacterium]
MNKFKIKYQSILLILLMILTMSGCSIDFPISYTSYDTSYSLDSIPEYSNSAYVIINENVPYFAQEELPTTSFEAYGDLDNLGRCTVALACVGIDLMPTEDRESISSIIPTGWNQAQYDNVDSSYLYNRCHLIGFQLTGENANEYNLITGTRYMNVEGMLPFENMIADYVIETENHVYFSVTPIFEEDNLVASGVLMEAMSVEDEGQGICFNVYCYNVQPNIFIDYSDGSSYYITENDNQETQSTEITYILNTSSKKFHEVNCSSVSTISKKNYEETSLTREELIEQGYSPCGNCDP